MIRSILCASVIALTTLAASPVWTSPQLADSRSIGALLNEERRAHGLQRVRENRQLTQAALAHAQWMQRTDQFSHTGENGSSLVQRVQAAGYCYRTVAENIAWNYPEAERLMNGWMNSPGHRANNLLDRVTQYGFAATEKYQVLVLGRPC